MNKYCVAIMAGLLMTGTARADVVGAYMAERRAEVTSIVSKTEADENYHYTDEEKCTISSVLAASIMSARQSGVPMSKLISMFGGDELSNELAKLAYKQDRWSSEEVQLRAIQDFENTAFQVCID